MLARVLHVHGIAARVFDADASPDRAAPPGRHAGSCTRTRVRERRSARAGGLHDEFRAAVLDEGDAVRVLDATGAVHVDEEGNGARPEIDRGALRALLLRSLPPGTVRWGHRSTGVRRTEGGAFEITWADGERLVTGALVGADGAFSKVRPLLTPAVPSYAGLCFVEEPHPRRVELGTPRLAAPCSGKGLDRSRALLREGHPRAPRAGRRAVRLRRVRGPGGLGRERDRRRVRSLLGLGHGWGGISALVSLVAETDQCLLVARAIHTLPIGVFVGPRVPGVTLLGDAAHLMSPFAGEGANIALFDGAELGAAIAKHPGDIEAALARYEAAMFPRSARAAQESADGLAMCFHPDAPGPLVAFFRDMAAGAGAGPPR